MAFALLVGLEVALFFYLYICWRSGRWVPRGGRRFREYERYIDHRLDSLSEQLRELRKEKHSD